MANTLQFDLVSPERKLASFEVTEVQIPGVDGDMTAMAGHVPTITTLRPGILKAGSAAHSKAYLVTGGFAEITASGVSVLAEQAVAMDEMTQARLDELIASARREVEGAPADARTRAEKVLNDFMAITL